MTIIDSYSAGAVGRALDNVNSAILIVGDAARQLPEAQAETFANHLANTIDRLREGRDLLEDVLYPAEVEEEDENDATAFGEIFEKAAHRAAPEGLRVISADDLLQMLRDRAGSSGGRDSDPRHRTVDFMSRTGSRMFEITKESALAAATDALKTERPALIAWRTSSGWTAYENMTLTELKSLRKRLAKIARMKQQHADDKEMWAASESTGE